jgi:hypothetical protein
MLFMNEVKVQSLIKLREVVAQQEELAFGKYIDYDGGECNNCVIGHLLKVGGVTNEQLKEIDNGKYKINDNDVTAYSIHTIFKKSQYHNFDDNFVQEALEGLGFNIREDDEMLSELQCFNDNYRGKKEMIIDRIDYFINDLQKETV